MKGSSADSDPIRALHVGKYFPPHRGGMETFLKEICSASQQLGIQCTALVHQSVRGFRSSQSQQQVNKQKILVVRVATWFRFLYAPISPLFGLHLQRILTREKPKVIHLHFPNPSAFWILLLPRAWRSDWLVHWQSDVITANSGLLLRTLYVFFSPFERAVLWRSKYIVVSSPNYLSYSKPLRKFKDKCKIIPLGIADRFNPMCSERSQASQPLRILSLGRLAHYKGHEVLLHALQNVSNAEVIIVGDGERSNSLKSLVAQLGIADRVSFFGAVTDSERDRFIRTCDCLCLASTDSTESFGIVLLEATSAGKPCVVSDVAGSGMSWVVDHESTGLVFQNASTRDLADSLQRLADDRELTEKLGENARAKYVKHFSIEKTASATISLYET